MKIEPKYANNAYFRFGDFIPYSGLYIYEKRTRPIKEVQRDFQKGAIYWKIDNREVVLLIYNSLIGVSGLAAIVWNFSTK